MRKVNIEEMAKGYQEMAEINLTISKEFFRIENEGERLYYELDSEKAQGEAG